MTRLLGKGQHTEAFWKGLWKDCMQQVFCFFFQLRTAILHLYRQESRPPNKQQSSGWAPHGKRPHALAGRLVVRSDYSTFDSQAQIRFRKTNNLTLPGWQQPVT